MLLQQNTVFLRKVLFILFAFFSITLAFPLGKARAYVAGTLTRINVGPQGDQSNGNEINSLEMTPDGRYVVYSSDASNLVQGDTNGKRDVFLLDRNTGTTIIISKTPSGQLGNNESIGGSISADGRYIAFVSNASNFHPMDTSADGDIYVKDLQTGALELASLTSTEEKGTGGGLPSISADGRFVAFHSTFYYDTSLPFDHLMHIYVRDRVLGTIERVSESSNGTPGNDWSLDPDLSADGRYVAFESWANNLVANDTNADSNNSSTGTDIFVHDRVTGVTQRVNIATDGTQANRQSENGKISDDGRYVTYYSEASNLVPIDDDDDEDVFLYDRLTLENIDVAPGQNGRAPYISANGRYVSSTYAFTVDIYDNQTDTSANLLTSDTAIHGENVVSNDGDLVAFVSSANNLAPNDTNGVNDIFLIVRNQQPFANAGQDQISIINNEVVLNGEESYDPDEDQLNYLWSEDSGNPQTGILQNPNTMTPSFTPTVAGVYTFSLIVNDGLVNSLPDSVVVTVQTPTQAVDDLVDLVEEINNLQGINNNSLDAKLSAALNALNDTNENNDQAAINSLESFINAVESQRGNQITNQQADQLIAAAQAIIGSLSN